LPTAENSAFQRSTLPKSFLSASASAPLGIALAAETVEVELVDDHRIRGDQFLALETVQDEDRRRRDVEAGQLGRDGVQPLHRAAVVVFIMADEQLLGDAFDLRRIERQLLDRILHLGRRCGGLGRRGPQQRCGGYGGSRDTGCADEVPASLIVAHGRLH